MSSHRFSINTAECVRRFDPKFSRAQKFIDSEVLRCSAPYVPKREGKLEQSGIIGTEIGSGKVVYNAPYAKKMYYGKSFNFSLAKHPKACYQWFEKAKAVHKKDWVAGVEKIVKE